MASRERMPARLDLAGLGAGRGQRDRKDPLICLCNRVPQSAILAAMAGGADTLAKLFDATFAGCGPCGGSCQPELQRMLYDFHQPQAAQQPQQPQQPQPAQQIQQNREEP